MSPSTSNTSIPRLATILLSVFALSSSNTVTAQNANCRVRREWSELSGAEQQRYISAVQQLKARPRGGNSASPGQLSYDDFVQIHLEASPTAHGVPVFLPWHRYFTWLYEEALRTIDPSITVPYWDWVQDAAFPHQSDIFQAFGGNGDQNAPGSRQGCVTSGPFASWQITVPPPAERGGNPCLKRCFDGQGNTIQPFWPLDGMIAEVFNATTFAEFSPKFEAGPHGRVHNGIGGGCGDMSQMYSVNDPIFFLHHSNVDRLYARWQAICPAYVTAYDGPGVSPSDPLTPWSLRVSDVFDIDGTGGSGICIQYSNPGANVPTLTRNCPPAPTRSTAASTSASTATATATPAASNLNRLSLAALLTGSNDEAWLIRALRDTIPNAQPVGAANATTATATAAAPSQTPGAPPVAAAAGVPNFSFGSRLSPNAAPGEPVLDQPGAAVPNLGRLRFFGRREDSGYGKYVQQQASVAPTTTTTTTSSNAYAAASTTGSTSSVLAADTTLPAADKYFQATTLPTATATATGLPDFDDED
ncbi:hypothetical protein HK102_009687, partial [Quaeritorhiza haematococci]